MASDETSTNTALDLLRSPNFFARLICALRGLGLIGEERNALVLYIIILSALLDRPITTIVKGSSSSGKNFLVSHVLRLVPESAVREITSSSKMAWNYGHDDFSHKVVYLQERNDAAGAVHPVRLLIREGKLRRMVTVRENGAWVTKTFVANGPIASISTTTRNQIEIDDETRHVSLWVDESRDQNRRIILGYISRQAGLNADDLKVWRRAHALLQEVADTTNILLPDWFEQIGPKVYAGNVAVRRYFPAFIEACKTIALIRTFQKTPGPHHDDAPDRIEVDFVDYSLAAILFENVFIETLHRNSDKNLMTRNNVEQILLQNNSVGVSAKDLAQHLGISEARAYASLREANEAGAIERANEPQRANVKLYKPTSLPRFVPDPQALFQDLPQIRGPLTFINPLNGENVQLSRPITNTSAKKKTIHRSAGTASR